MGTEQTASAPRVLIVRLGAMGDVLHALPAVALLREALPQAHIGWVIEERWRELLCAPGVELAGPCSDQRPLADQVHVADTRAWRKHPLKRDVRQQLSAAIRQLRACGYAAALELQGAMKSGLLARLSGAGLIIGFRHPREALARLFYGKIVEAQTPHVIEQNVELASAWLENHGGPYLPAVGRCGDVELDVALALRRRWPQLSRLLPRHPASEASVSDKLQSLSLTHAPLAILNPGAGWAAKQWAPERYAALAKALAARGLCSVVNYGPGEEALASAVASASTGAALPLFTTISEFIALARRARLFVGGDTGPMHLAALLGVPTLALFGPTDPARNGPYWPRTRVLRHPASLTSYSHSRTRDAGLEKLSVERVLATADRLIEN